MIVCYLVQAKEVIKMWRISYLWHVLFPFTALNNFVSQKVIIIDMSTITN